MTYDAENRLVTAAGVTYTYDGDGKRVKKSNGKLYWTGVGSDPLYETDLAGNNPTEYIFFNGKRVARRDPNGSVFFYFSDHLGSADVITNSTGTIAEESDYYPFGGERIIIGGDPNPYKFTGKERDGESGLDYFIARHYSSNLGRYLQPDWDAAPTAVPYADYGNPQSLNLYTYVGNNPIVRFDADGHCWPVSECVATFQSAVDSATEKVIDASINSGNPLLAGVTTAVAGTGRDLVNGTADAFNAGDAIGACADSCTAVETADAVGQDLARAAGLVGMAAGAVGAGETIAAKVGGSPKVAAAEAAAEPHPSITAPYKRPSGATTPEQRAAVQGKPCVECGQTKARMNAHHDPALVKEYYKTGSIDKTRMRSPKAVKPHCPTCSAREGGKMSQYSKKMKKKLPRQK